MKTPILGSSYTARSVNAADDRCVNLFPEVLQEGGLTPGYLLRAPGLRLLAAVGMGPIRGLWTFGGYSYVVSGTELYRVNSSWVSNKLGNVTGTGPVSMADNGTQLFVACNGPSFIYNASTSAFSQITDPDFPGAVTVGYLDGYFIFNQPNSQKFWITSLLDGTAIDPLDFASAESSPDNLVALLIDHKEVWLFGTNSIEVRYDSGSSDFPIQPIQGAFNETGLTAAYSVAKLDNGIFWLGADARGNGIVYRANGYIANRVSTHAMEWQIQSYGDISDAIAYSYQQDGHSFYVLTFPSANATWVYDVATNAWHERAGFENGVFTRHRSNCQMNFNNEIVVGDFENGNIYAFDLTMYSDNGAIQKWLRAWRALPTGENDMTRTSHHSLQVTFQQGVGLISGQGSDPQVFLRFSDDGGHTWSSEEWASMGRLGEYGYRTIWRRLGMTTRLRDRVYEISGTDPVKVAITGAELLVSGTNA